MAIAKRTEEVDAFGAAQVHFGLMKKRLSTDLMSATHSELEEYAMGAERSWFGS